MGGPIFYVDTSDIREGALDQVRVAIKGLVDFVEAKGPPLIAYSIYLSDDGKRMTVAHLHNESATLDYLMEVGAPEFRKFADLITLRSIDVYGEVSDKVLKQLHWKAEMLGGGSLAVHHRAAGFARLG